MRAKSKLKQFEKRLNLGNKKYVVIMLDLDHSCIDERAETKARMSVEEIERKYPLRQRFLNSENCLEILQTYFKSKEVVFPKPGDEVIVLECRFETINVLNIDEVIAYSELEPFMAPE